MSSGTNPTNEHIVRLLNDVLAELKDVKGNQKQLAKDVQKVAGHLRVES